MVYSTQPNMPPSHEEYASHTSYSGPTYHQQMSLVTDRYVGLALTTLAPRLYTPLK
jgi:hypothetical protein